MFKVGDQVRIKKSIFAEEENRVPLPTEPGTIGTVESTLPCGYAYTVDGHAYFDDELEHVQGETNDHRD